MATTPFFGDNGQLVVYGGAGNDLISGSNATFDILYGGDGADPIYAIGTGNDTLFGESGNDVLYGGASLGTIYGGEGNDTIFFGSDGADNNTAVVTLSGGEGADEFTFTDDGTGVGYADASAGAAATATYTTIADFDSGTDKISLYSLFASTVSPAVVNQGMADATSNNMISWTTSGADVKVAIIGDADEYLFLNLTGVTTLA